MISQNFGDENLLLFTFLTGKLRKNLLWTNKKFVHLNIITNFCPKISSKNIFLTTWKGLWTSLISLNKLSWSEIASCSSPLKPTGHCCYNICGAIIYIEKPWDAIDVPFNLIEAKNDMEALINPPPPRKGFSFKSKPFEFWHIISKY